MNDLHLTSQPDNSGEPGNPISTSGFPLGDPNKNAYYYSLEGDGGPRLIQAVTSHSDNHVQTNPILTPRTGRRPDSSRSSCRSIKITLPKPHISQTAAQRPDERIIRHQYKAQLQKQIDEQKRIKEESLKAEKVQEEKLQCKIEEDRQKMVTEQQEEIERKRIREEALKQREELTSQRIEASRLKAQEDRKKRMNEKRQSLPEIDGERQDGNKLSQSSLDLNQSTYSNPYDETPIKPQKLNFDELLAKNSNSKSPEFLEEYGEADFSDFAEDEDEEYYDEHGDHGDHIEDDDEYEIDDDSFYGDADESHEPEHSSRNDSKYELLEYSVITKTDESSHKKSHGERTSIKSFTASKPSYNPPPQQQQQFSQPPVAPVNTETHAIMDYLKELKLILRAEEERMRIVINQRSPSTASTTKLKSKFGFDTNKSPLVATSPMVSDSEQRMKNEDYEIDVSSSDESLCSQNDSVSSETDLDN